MDLPAPFSPIIPWIVPDRTSKLIESFARTGPKRLQISFNETANGGDSPPFCLVMFKLTVLNLRLSVI